MLIVLFCIAAIIMIIFIVVYNFTDKSRFRIDRQFSYVCDLFDGWVDATGALLSMQASMPERPDSGLDWRGAMSAYSKAQHADVRIRCVNALSAAYKSIAGSLPDNRDISSLISEKNRFEDELHTFRSVYNECAAVYNKRLALPVFRQCSKVMRKTAWEELFFPKQADKKL